MVLPKQVDAMKTVRLKLARRKRRKAGLRKRIMGTAERPRLTVYRSLRHISAQLVDDLQRRTLVAASSQRAGSSGGGNVPAAKEVGPQLAEKAAAAGIKQAACDRNGFKIHGRGKALADAAREGGLSF